MNFRRMPFQFSTTDPSKRQAELQKRFGLPAKTDNMYVDLANPVGMGGSEVTNSPRLQHRVPIFVEGSSETRPSVDAQNNDVGRKPHVRVVPIEIEGVNSTSPNRYQNFSGPTAQPEEKTHQNSFWPPWRSASSLKRPAAEPTSKNISGPKVCNIPIKVERDGNSKPPVSKQQEKSNPLPKKASQKTDVSKEQEKSAPPLKQANGCGVSKASNSAPKQSLLEQMSIKKVESVLEKLKGYLPDVEKFSGTSEEKQYRYLDEMLTRCMLQLDDIDTMGNETVRLTRKSAIREVQAAIDLLETKVLKDTSRAESDEGDLSESNGECPEDVEMVESSENVIPSVLNSHDENGELQSSNASVSEDMNLGDSQSIDNIHNVQTGLTDISTEALQSSNVSESVEDMNIDDSQSTDNIHNVQTGEVDISAAELQSSNISESVEDANIDGSQSATGVVNDGGIPADPEPIIEEPVDESDIDHNKCEAVNDSSVVISEFQENITICDLKGKDELDNSLVTGELLKCDSVLPANNEISDSTPCKLDNINDARSCI